VFDQHMFLHCKPEVVVAVWISEVVVGEKHDAHPRQECHVHLEAHALVFVEQ
jgi:hypothetical protein